MARNLGDKLRNITQEAEEREEKKKKEWIAARKTIREVLSEAESSLEGSESKERNGNSNSLSYRRHDIMFILQFTYSQSKHTVSRHDYGIGKSRDYDLEEIDRSNLEEEIEEFVRYIHSIPS